MKLRKELLLFSVISVVFLAGCTGGGETPTGTGVIIKSFAPDLTSVDGGSIVVTTVVVKNVGARAATNVNANLFGLSNEWSGMSSKLVTSTLASADPATGLPGEEASQDWTLTTPAGKGSDVTYDASVRVNFTYTTVSDSLLRFVNSNYARTNPNVPKGVMSSQSTAGPLSITVFARTPVVAADSKGRVQFEIQNVGGGRVGTEDAAGLDVIKEIKITGVGSTGSCAGGAAGNVQTLSNQRLAGGKSKIISCEIGAGTITNFQDVALNLTSTYDYFIDSATQVTVLRALQ